MPDHGLAWVSRGSYPYDLALISVRRTSTCDQKTSKMGLYIYLLAQTLGL